MAVYLGYFILHDVYGCSLFCVFSESVVTGRPTASDIGVFSSKKSRSESSAVLSPTGQDYMASIICLCLFEGLYKLVCSNGAVK